MDALYMADCYLKEFTSTVASVDQGKHVILKETAFYPNAGGQPNDLGTMTTGDGTAYAVMSVGTSGGIISHEVDRPGLKPGGTVRCAIDWDRRYRLMRSHTAAHVLSRVIIDATGAKITGNQLGLDRSRIDFDLEGFDRDKIAEYERRANGIIAKALPVTISTMPREDAFRIPGLFQLRDVLPPDVKELRIIAIEGFDTSACGGTHVKNIGEIKGIRVVKAENKGRSNRRIYYELVD
ncbi:alanyl-tRNA editing protein [Candidatus Woesearchaeota archaeon]|nr:alanyl-tRNA editing protein [Candidatus Woesearchaeota archaeon]